MRGIYLVTDRGLCGGRSLEEVVGAALRGGVAYVQLREKNLSTRMFVEEARVVKQLLASRGVPLIINDRLDVALACEADGVHIGQDDMPYETARRFWGRRRSSVCPWKPGRMSRRPKVGRRLSGRQSGVCHAHQNRYPGTLGA